MSTDWEFRYQEQDTPWDKGSASPPLLEWLAVKTLSGRVFVPGCGLGHDVRAIASVGAEVVGLDLAPSAVALAGKFPAVGLETYVEGDLFCLPDDWLGSFDWAFEHTCFCAIDPSLRSNYVRAIHAALKPAGRLLAVFYMDPGPRDWEGPPFGSELTTLKALFSSHFRWVDAVVPRASYREREGRELVVELERID